MDDQLQTNANALPAYFDQVLGFIQGGNAMIYDRTLFMNMLKIIMLLPFPFVEIEDRITAWSEYVRRADNTGYEEANVSANGFNLTMYPYI